MKVLEDFLSFHIGILYLN